MTRFSKITFSAAKGNCGPETGVKARTADWSRRWGRDRQSITDFANTLLAATDNKLKRNLHLDRFLQHRHSATRLRLLALVVCFSSSLLIFSSLRRFERRFETNTRPLPTEYSRRRAKSVRPKLKRWVRPLQSKRISARPVVTLLPH